MVDTISEVLPRHIKNMMLKINPRIINELEEIRIRISKPIILRTHDNEFGIFENGACKPNKGYCANKTDIDGILKFASGFSMYAIEDELRSGFITIAGGHRIGVVGRAVIDNKNLKTITNISAINIRIAREVVGAGNKIVPYIYKNRKICNTLIVSPPKCGKTTILRDVIRNLSNGESLDVSYHVGIVDERSEIAACYMGIPQNDVGIRTDVLDSAPKAEGILMLLRSMSPEIIAVDEIGRDEDYKAIFDALIVGVTVICTIHGSSLNDCLNKPLLKDMLDKKLFERIIILSNNPKVGTVKEVIDVRNNYNIIR
ncbi:stage III sporulation protein AA [Candidatus Epulonipiscium viviparus]|uniref:stage III sporulation protein AA n=1 Tax=Candidatus Epulonipiscium viviparus TaxID=420336 RepID=UPI00016BFB13|nr:stage III sporulation protein AA [Candidatus Epulopiscium viviparus]